MSPAVHQGPALDLSPILERAAQPARASRVAARKVVARTPAQRRAAARLAQARRLAPVARFARSQVGDRYRFGAAGPHSWDCSGLTQAAYRRAGKRLPHQSTGQRNRAYRISRAAAVPGDLVVGPGHVGIYMGGGRMVDAGNSRVGVVHRRMYRGLTVYRVR